MLTPAAKDVSTDAFLKPLVLASLIHIEGIRLLAYADPVTNGAPWTNGIGNTADANGRPWKRGDRLPSIQAAKDLCWATVSKIRPKLHAALKPEILASLLPREECSLLTWQYNVGSTAMSSSTLIRKLNAGDRAGAAAQFAVWDRSGGRVVHGLDVRREWETGVFLGTIDPLTS